MTGTSMTAVKDRVATTYRKIRFGNATNQHFRCFSMLRVVDGLIPRPHSFMLSDSLALAKHLHPIQIRDNFDTSPDHPGMHRVIVQALTQGQSSGADSM